MSSNRRGYKANLSCYGAWADMLQRCKNPNLPYYKNYGGRGIKVCDRWKSFDNFYKDMGDKLKGYTLGRINNDGNYEPNNCRWETIQQQARNRSDIHWVEFKGKKLSVSEWAEIMKISRITLYHRLGRGWSETEALTVRPLGRGQHR